jgi:hypothetical protein
MEQCETYVPAVVGDDANAYFSQIQEYVIFRVLLICKQIQYIVIEETCKT